MARIRTIKPDFWASDQVTDCSPMARLLFIGSWNFADDAGVLPFKPKTLKAKVFPADDVDADDVRRMVDELVRVGLLGLFESDGVLYLFVTGWKAHQKIDRPSYRYPSPPKKYEPDPDQLSLLLRRTLDEGHPPEGKGMEGKGMEGTALDEGSSIASAADPALAVIAAFDEVRIEVFGESQARPWKHPNDLTDARRFVEAGATAELCREVFSAVMQRQKSINRQPPGNLRYFERPIADAIAGVKAPMPEARANGAPAGASQPTKDEIREQMRRRAEAIKRGTYLSVVTVQDVQGMIKCGWLTAAEATKAGYPL